MNKKFRTYLMFFLVLGSVGWSSALAQNVIRDFPYETFLGDWEFGGSDGGGHGGRLTSPILDFSTLEEPELTFCAGVEFVLEDEKGRILCSRDDGNKDEVIVLSLPKDVKQLRLDSYSFWVGEYFHFKYLAIAEKGKLSFGNGDIVINQFPFSLEYKDPRWKYSRSAWDDLQFIVHGDLISPKIEFSGPGGLLEIEGKGPYNVYTSMDGDNYTLLKEVREYDKSFHDLMLDKNVHYIQFKLGSGGAAIKNITVNEFSGDISWTNENDEYVLTGTTAPEGTTLYCWLPDITTGAEVNKKSNKLVFNVSNSIPDHLQLYFVETSSTYGKKETPITVSDGKAVIDLPYGKYSAAIKAVMKKGGEVPTVKISGFNVLKPSMDMQRNSAQWYDEDHDGNIEFFSSTSSEKFKIQDGMAYKYGEFPNGTSDIYPCNIDNDSKMDYYNFFREGQETGYKEYYLVYTRNEDSDVDITQKIYSGSYKRNFVSCDYNNDGRTDFLLDNDQVAVQLIDGTFSIHRLEIISQEEYQNKDKSKDWNQYIPSHLVTSTFNDAFLSAKDMFIGSDSEYSGNMNSVSQIASIDFNKDGRPDLLNNSTGTLLLNVAEDKYVSIPLGGALYFRDLNGDQRLDYIVYEPSSKTVTSHVYQADGSETIQMLMSNLSMDQQVWCYDFDRDGDVDILLPFSYLESNGASFLVIMENDGNGNFKKHENYFDEKLKFIACADLDHDGYYDVLAGEEASSERRDPLDARFLKGNASFSFSLQQGSLAQLLQEGYRESIPIVQVADVNNDGIYEIMAPGVAFSLPDVTPNQAPEKPEKPTCLFESSTGYLKINWQQGKDAESSSVDLTYALRIGTQPGKGDMYYAHAMEDGTRLNLLDGNMGYDLGKLLDVSNWNAGKYYIAVQTIDPMHKGSGWSDEAVFDKTQLSATFRVSDERAVGDTLTVALTDHTSPTLHYDWDWDGAEIISVNATKTIYLIRFLTPGEKHISLQTKDEKGNISLIVDKELFIFGNRFVRNELTILPDISDICKMMDMDGDGNLELFTNNGVYERNEDGGYTKIKKIYNTNLTFGNNGNENVIWDVDKDGFADELYYGPSSILKQHLNIGNKELLVENIPANSSNMYWDPIAIVDFDHDGNFDCLCSRFGHLPYLNSGNHVDFNEADFITSKLDIICDWNSDGFIDGIYEYTKKDSETGEVYFCLCFNNGDGTFTEKRVKTAYLEDRLKIGAVADMNNDGYPDLIMQKNPTTLIIALNNKNTDFDEIKEVVLPLAYGDMNVAKLVDFDNNGYLDILVSGTHGYFSSSIVYFYDDWKYEVQNYNDDVFKRSDILFPIDLNQDGNQDYLSDTGKGMFSRATHINSFPEAPQNVRASQQEDFIVIQWDAAKDTETPYTQMRYNISVKKQGVKGKDAFVLSPLNGLNEHAAIVPDYVYPMGTIYSIPLRVMPAGIYELQIQAIDGQNAVSSFSGPFIFEVEATPKVRVPANVCVGYSATIEYKGNSGISNPLWNWDGGELLYHDGNTYDVVWNTEGIKHLSVTVDGVTSETTLYVAPAINIDYTIYAHALVNAENKLTLPEGDYFYFWTYSEDGSEFKPVSRSSSNPFENVYSPIRIVRRGNTTEAKVIFSKEGTYILRLNAETPCGIISSDQTIVVNGKLQKQEIAMVTADPATGKYRISWALPDDLPSYVNGVNIYKEGSKYNDFRLLATLPVKDNHYIDLSSNPEISSSRYQLTLLTSYGAETTPGTPHKGVHLMLNRGVGNSWNLVWTPYEGSIVESYRILRGDSPDNLSVIDEVSGSQNSYSDHNAPEGMCYYALDFNTKYEENWTPMNVRGLASFPGSVRSNVISVANAPSVVFAERVYVHSREEQMELSREQMVSHLYAELYPLTSTFRAINWTVISGNDIASINQEGVLTACGDKNGMVTVRARAIDGSGVSAEVVVPVSGFDVGIEEINSDHSNKLLLYPSPATNELHICGIPENGAIVYIVNMDGQIISRFESTDTELLVPCGALSSGIYGVKVVGKNNVISAQFIKK